MTRMYTNYFNLCGSGKLICNKCKVIIIMNPQVIWEYRQNSPYPSNTQNRFWSLEPVNVPSHSHGHVLIYSTADLKIRKLSYTPHLIILSVWKQQSFAPGTGKKSPKDSNKEKYPICSCWFEDEGDHLKMLGRHLTDSHKKIGSTSRFYFCKELDSDNNVNT